FEEWSVVFDRKYGQRAPREDWYGAVLAGARLALATGTTTVAEISTDFEAVPAVREAGLGGVVYLEALGHTWDAGGAGERARYLAASRMPSRSRTTASGSGCPRTLPTAP